MNTRIRELAKNTGFKVNYQHEDVQAIKLARLTKFAQQIVGETVLAVLATDLREYICTSYDADMAHAVTNKIINNIRNHWSFV